MRRVLFAIVASSVVLAIAPAAALAHSHHHRGHHRAQRTHARVRDEHFGSWNDGNTAATGAPNAGTVAGFNNGVLTLRLNDGSMVSGQVDGATEFQCEGAPSQDMEHSRHADGDQGAGSGGSGSGDGADNNENNDSNDNNDNQGQDDQGAAMCSTANLVPGTMVSDAELTISGAGGIWKEVDLAGQGQ